MRGFHAVNLLIHLLAALVLFGVVRRTLLTSSLKEQFGGAASGLAMAVALIWAVHPLLTESVTYLTQRTESLMGLFFLLTLYCAIRGASSGHPWRWYAVAIAACALGMGAKEVMATAPIVVLLYDRCFLSGSFREALPPAAALLSRPGRDVGDPRRAADRVSLGRRRPAPGSAWRRPGRGNTRARSRASF